ncbi:MAG: rhodanese-like domain-containing protein [Nitrospirota bacterium]
MKRGLLSVFVSVVFLFASIGAGYAAQWANPDLLVAPDVVEKNISKPDWVVIDCRKLEDYAKGHIPGSISIGKNCKKALRDGTSRAFDDASKYEKLLSKIGIGNTTHVVVYGDLKTKSLDDATVAFWVLEYIGHDKVHVLNGGLEAWTAAGKKLDTAPTMKQPAAFKAKVVKGRYASTDEVLKIAKGQAKGVQLIDARTKGEHEGDDIRALRGGRIPHTDINIPHTDTYDKKKDPATGKDVPTSFLSHETVAKFYEKLDKSKRTIGYCQTGTRSTLTYLELRLLGFKEPANYDDSWTVWGNAVNKGYPVEDEQWIDLSRIKSLEDDVKKLKEKLEKTEGEKK